jgi:hypothetical protein
MKCGMWGKSKNFYSRLYLANILVCPWMPKPRVNDTELDKIARFERIKKAITALEKQLAQISKQGDLAPEGSWVARYQVRQNQKKYWYYKLQASTACLPRATSLKLSKYKHLGCIWYSRAY